MEKDKGREYLDATPVAVPVKFRGVAAQGDRLKELMRSLIVDLRDNSHVESFEESLDFDVDDEDDPLSRNVSPSEMRFMQEEKLLQDAQEASNMVSRSREAANYRSRKNAGRSEQRRNEAGASGAGDVGKGEAPSGVKGGEYAGGKGREREGGGGDRGGGKEDRDA